MSTEVKLTIFDKIRHHEDYFEHLPKSYNRLFYELCNQRRTDILWNDLDDYMREALMKEIPSGRDAGQKFYHFWHILHVNQMVCLL